MKKRYIDFVPAKKGTVARKPVAKKPASKPAVKPAPKPVKKVVKRIPAANPLLDEEIVVEEIFAEREEPAKMGVVEDYQPKFVKTEVKKRPLGKKPVAKTATKVATKAAVAKTTAKTTAAKAATKAVPKKPAPMGQRAKFINADKIEKRPLSKSVSVKKPMVIPKEEKPSAPEKIIAKPEKDSKAGLIIAIILTIILGAAAGTVAFLLLPK